MNCFSFIPKWIILLVMISCSVPAMGESEPEDAQEVESFSLSSNRAAFDEVKQQLRWDLIGSAEAFETLYAKLWKWSRLHGDTTDRLWLELQLAIYARQTGQTRQAINILDNISHSTKCTEYLRFRAKELSRNLYFNLDAYDKALELHQQLDWEQAPVSEYSLMPDIFLGLLYYRIGDYTKAIKVFRKAIRVFHEEEEHFFEMQYTNNLGLAFEKAEMPDSALHYFNQALEILENEIAPKGVRSETQIEFIRGLYIGNKAQVLASQGNHLEAIPLYKQDILASLNDTSKIQQKENAVISYIKLSNSYIAIGAPKQADVALEKARRIMADNDKVELWESYYTSLAKLHQAMDNKPEALDALVKLNALRDSIQRAERITRSQNMLIAYESDLAEQQRIAQERRIMELRREAEKQRQTNLIFGMIIVFVVIIASAAIYRFRAKSKQERSISEKNVEIEKQKATIQQALQEKETLLREVNHRVKNNLQIISSLLYLQSRNIEDVESKVALKQAQQRVQTMALIHQKLYQESQYNRVDFRSYMRELVQQIVSSYRSEGLKIEPSVEIEKDELPVDKAVPLSLIVHELITNSIKHAFKGRKKGVVSVRLRPEDNHLVLHYADNGVGLADTVDINDLSSIGFKVILLLTQQLDGQFKVVQARPLIIEVKFASDWA